MAEASSSDGSEPASPSPSLNGTNGRDAPETDLSRRVLVLAPTGRDAVLACRILRDAGMTASPCPDLHALCDEAREGAGVLVLSMEALNDDSVSCIREFKAGEPSWSEIPIILLGTEGKDSFAYLSLLGNVTLLDRPLRIAEFLAAARASLHSRERQYQVRDLLEEIAQAQVRQRAFLSDVLSSVTRGKLRLCDPEETTEAGWTPLWSHPLREKHDITLLRQKLRETSMSEEIGEDRWENFLVAAGEASTNALKHGKGGRASFFAQEERVCLRIEDEGPGISLENLPRATLQSGYSSARTLGMGFTAIVEFVDQITLATDAHGTVVTLEIHRKPEKDAFIDQLLESYNDEGV